MVNDDPELFSDLLNRNDEFDPENISVIQHTESVLEELETML